MTEYAQNCIALQEQLDLINEDDLPPLSFSEQLRQSTIRETTSRLSTILRSEPALPTSHSSLLNSSTLSVSDASGRHFSSVNVSTELVNSTSPSLFLENNSAQARTTPPRLISSIINDANTHVRGVQHIETDNNIPLPTRSSESDESSVCRHTTQSAGASALNINCTECNLPLSFISRRAHDLKSFSCSSTSPILSSNLRANHAEGNTIRAAAEIKQTIGVATVS